MRIVQLQRIQEPVRTNPRTSENPLLLKDGMAAPKAQTGVVLFMHGDYLNHPACSPCSQAPLLQKEGICDRPDISDLRDSYTPLIAAETIFSPT